MDKNSVFIRFWETRNTKELDAFAVSLYMFLLFKCIDESTKQISISDLAIAGTFKINRRTIRGARIALRNAGLIEFYIQKGIACSYVLLIREDIHFKPDKEEKQINNYKNQINKKVPATFRPRGKPIEGTKIPSMDEFMVFAKTLKGYNQDLDIVIEGKYETWKADGWVTGYGRPIKNWQAALKNSWPFMIQKPDKSNAINLDTLPSIRRPKATYNED